MNHVTQQNAATAEESSSAASELSSQSEELAAMVGSFRIDKVLANAPAGTPVNGASSLFPPGRGLGRGASA
jgi:methyl-accepting chemotaxis protein